MFLNRGSQLTLQIVIGSWRSKLILFHQVFVLTHALWLTFVLPNLPHRYWKCVEGLLCPEHPLCCPHKLHCCGGTQHFARAHVQVRLSTSPSLCISNETAETATRWRILLWLQRSRFVSVFLSSPLSWKSFLAMFHFQESLPKLNLTSSGYRSWEELAEISMTQAHLQADPRMYSPAPLSPKIRFRWGLRCLRSVLRSCCTLLLGQSSWSPSRWINPKGRWCSHDQMWSNAYRLS